MLVKHGPETIQAARVGDPTLADPPATLAPDVNKQSVAMFNAARNNQPLPSLIPTAAQQTAAASTAAAVPAEQNQAPAATLQLESVPDQGGAANGVSATQVTPAATPGSTVTVEVPNGGSEPPANNGAGAAVTGTIVSPAPAAGTTPAPVVGGPGPLATGATDANGAYTGAPPAGTGATTNAKPVVDGVGPPVSKPLPPIDKPAAAPNQINDVTHAPQVNTATKPNQKAKKAPYNSKEESSSKHKKKKGLDKLNPF